MELWVVRHAKTAWNETDRYQGHTDTPLCQEGLQEISSWKVPTVPEVIFSSPLVRALDTAKALFPGKEIHSDIRLREMSLGAWEGKTHSEVREEYGELPNGGWYGLDFRAHGGETLRDVMARLEPWLQEVSNLQASSVFAVSHKATIMALFAMATGWDYTYKPNPRIRFPGFHGFKLEKGGKVTPLKINVALEGGNPK